MKRTQMTIGMLVSVLLTVALWTGTVRAQSGHTSAGQQVGERFRVPAIAAGQYHSLALKSDGTVVAWGRNDVGQTTVPAGLSGITAIAAGGFHSLALAWGNNGSGQSNVPAGLSGVTAIAGGGNHSLALSLNAPPTIAASVVSRHVGAPAINSTIATVSDDAALTNVSVTATPLSVNGVTVTNLSVDANGNVTADVAATCNASTSTFTLRVTDGGGLFAETTLTVTLILKLPPTISYPGNPARSMAPG